MSSIVCWNHIPKKNTTDYSECVCEPDLVLSMREIIDKYLQTGQVPAGMSLNGSYSEVDFDDANETDFDDTLDVLCHAKHIRSVVEEDLEIPRSSKSSDNVRYEQQSADEPNEEAEQLPTNHESEKAPQEPEI